MPPRKFSKLEEFLARCHDFQPIKLMHRLNVNDNVSFTLQKPEIDWNNGLKRISSEVSPILWSFQNTVRAWLNANKSSWMLVYSRCFFVLLSHSYPLRLSASLFGYQCPWWGYNAQNASAVKGSNAHFSNCRENQVNGDSTRTKKLKLQSVLSDSQVARRVQFVSPTVLFALQEFYFSSLLCTILFFQLLSLTWIFFFWLSPITFRMVGP